jgi:transcriptional regulator with XRE-family HTH domain
MQFPSLLDGRDDVLKMSRPQLAERLGVSQSTLYRQERAKKVDSLYRLACAAIGAAEGHGIKLEPWGATGRARKPRRQR